MRGLGSKKPAKAAVALERQWLQIDLVSPSGEIESFQRDVARGPEGRPELEFKGMLGSIVRLGFSVGELPRAYLFDLMLDQLSEVAVAMAAMDCSGEMECEVNEQDLPGFQSLTVDFASFFHGSSRMAGTIVPDATIYRSEPSVVAQYQNSWMVDRWLSGVDIINNTRRAVRSEPEGVTLDARAALRQGVVESLFEEILAPGLGSEPVSAAVALRVSGWGVQPLVLRPSDRKQVDRLAYEDLAKENLRKDLGAGFTLVIPNPDVNSTGSPTWWRIDPLSGETLGMIGVGWGGYLQEGTDEVTLLAQAIAWARAIFKWGRLLSCLLLAVTIFVAVSIVVGAIKSPAKVALMIAKFLEVMGRADLIPNIRKILAGATTAAEVINIAICEIFYSCIGKGQHDCEKKPPALPGGSTKPPALPPGTASSPAGGGL
jgi:hypothetical protein